MFVSLSLMVWHAICWAGGDIVRLCKVVPMQSCLAVDAHSFGLRLEIVGAGLKQMRALHTATCMFEA